MNIKKTRGGKVVIELEKGDSFPETTDAKSTQFSLRRILVPIDFSDCSRKALEYAVPYAKEFQAAITLLYVAQFHYVASELDSAEAPVLENKHLERAKTELSNLAGELSGEVAVSSAVVSGRPFEEIVATAKALSIDLIIIGTHGATGRGDYLGSTAERVARYADCPVLIVREREREFLKRLKVSKPLAGEKA
jgi:nucleotide-binding universal stress UspA family protein